MLAKLNAAAPGIAHAVHYAELSRRANVSRVAAEIAGAEMKIDVLINNAGALFPSCPHRIRSCVRTNA
jgi:short-subunit dehydrogenase